MARLYGFDPAPYPTAVGIEAALWTELVHTDEAADNRLWPRLAASAELAWTGADRGDYAGFVQRMQGLRGHLDAMGIAYHPEEDLGWDE